jgi:hypothetical protein
MDNIDTKNELQSLAPYLARLEKKNQGGFQVPNQYFEQSLEEVIKKMGAEQTPVATPNTIAIQARKNDRTMWLLRIAAGFLILVVAIFAFQRYNRQYTTSPVATITIPTETAEWYILSNLEDFQEELLQVHHNTPTDTLGQERALDEYLDYLLEDVDMETLEELL